MDLAPRSAMLRAYVLGEMPWPMEATLFGVAVAQGEGSNGGPDEGVYSWEGQPSLPMSLPFCALFDALHATTQAWNAAKAAETIRDDAWRSLRKIASPNPTPGTTNHAG